MQKKYLAPLNGRRLPLAYDRSVRRVDKDGHLFVDTCTLSAAVVSEYYGWEIPDGDARGFERDRKYRLYRDANSLKAAAPTLNGKPILMDHRSITADSHPHEIVVGSVGSDVRFENPRLIGSLSFWAPEAIRAIQAGTMRSVSAGYRYRAVRVSGSVDGDRYDGIMTDISFNHLALVEAPRVPDAVIGDSLPLFMDIKKMADTLESLINERIAFLRSPGDDAADFNTSWLERLDELLTGETRQSSGAMDFRRLPSGAKRSTDAGWRYNQTGKLTGVLSPLNRIKVL